MAAGLYLFLSPVPLPLFKYFSLQHTKHYLANAPLCYMYYHVFVPPPQCTRPPPSNLHNLPLTNV